MPLPTRAPRPLIRLTSQALRLTSKPRRITSHPLHPYRLTVSHHIRRNRARFPPLPPYHRHLHTPFTGPACRHVRPYPGSRSVALERDIGTIGGGGFGEPEPEQQQPMQMNVERYHTLADAYIDNLVTHLEELQEEREDVDVEYSAGVLTLSFPPAGTYVLNKQPPNRQIWLSSPVSGPKRFDYVGSDHGDDGGAAEGVQDGEEGGGGTEGEWVYLRDGASLTEILEGELGIRLGGEGEA